jgi:hypothetical protein
MPNMRTVFDRKGCFLIIQLPLLISDYYCRESLKIIPSVCVVLHHEPRLYHASFAFFTKVEHFSCVVPFR